jgi:hypothetical protein
MMEAIRFWILSYETYLQLQADVAFIKQVFIASLREGA